MARLVAERADVVPKLAEVFREHGYDGASLALISIATGLGKGSLYHFFPDGKEAMVLAVLEDIDAWFESHIFKVLRETDEPAQAINAMFDTVDTYFKSGQRVCLVGAIALSDTRDRFRERIHIYFQHWIIALACALEKQGFNKTRAFDLAEEVILSIQGAIVLARATDDYDVFERVMGRLKKTTRLYL